MENGTKILGVIVVIGIIVLVVWYFGFRNKKEGPGKGGIGGDRVQESRNYLDLGLGTLCSDDNLEEIESLAECIRALDELKIPSISSTPQERADEATTEHPAGCIRVVFNSDITGGTFNNISPGTGNSWGVASPICRKG